MLFLDGYRAMDDLNEKDRQRDITDLKGKSYRTFLVFNSVLDSIVGKPKVCYDKGAEV